MDGESVTNEHFDLHQNVGFVVWLGQVDLSLSLFHSYNLHTC